MKHWYLGLAAVAIVIMPFAFRGNTEDTPYGGPCGTHQGLACAVGPDSDGSVVCIDGFRDVDVQYAAACGSVSIPVPERPVFVGEPKTRENLMDCKVVGIKDVNKYFLKGDSVISEIGLDLARCFSNSGAAEAVGFTSGR